MFLVQVSDQRTPATSPSQEMDSYDAMSPARSRFAADEDAEAAEAKH